MIHYLIRLHLQTIYSKIKNIKIATTDHQTPSMGSPVKPVPVTAVRLALPPGVRWMQKCKAAMRQRTEIQRWYSQII